MAGNLSSSTHLNVNNQSRMPFSSPIWEEVPSPVSPLDAPRTPQLFPRKILDPFSSPPLPADDSNVDSRESCGSSINYNRGSPGSSPRVAQPASWAVEAARAATRNAAPRHTRNFSIGKLSRDKSRRSKKQDAGRAKLGIRVVTNFSKPHDSEQVVQRPTNPQAHSNQAMTRQGSVQRQGQQAGAFVSLSDLKAIDGAMAPKGIWKSVAGDGHKQKKNKSKAEDTKRTEKRKHPLLSGTSPQKTMSRGFKIKTLRQNIRNFEDISDREDEVPILAGDAGATAEPTRPIPTEQPDSRIAADPDTTDYLAPSPTKTEDGLSPSDRPIVIGLSIPSAKLAEFQFSPQSASSYSANPNQTPNGHKREPSEAITITPTILVTPASDGLGRMPFRTEQATKGRPRARSSIYSQPGMSPAGKADAIPPLPTMPASAYKTRTSENPFETKANIVRDSTITVFEEDEEPKTNGRGVSTYTVFEEDESPTELERGRHRSGSGTIGPADRSSTDTVGTHRRSLGWWNYLLTPFLTRSNTSATDKHQRSPSDKWERPVLPNLAEAATVVSLQEKRDEKRWEVGFSPDTDSPVRPKSGHTTMWSDMSTWEDEREAIGIAIDHTPRTSAIKPKTQHHAHKSSGTIPVMMTGGSAGASTTVDFQGTNKHNQHNPFRQVEEHKVEAQANSQGSNPFHPLVDPQAGPEGRGIPNPFDNTYQQATNQGQNPFWHDPPSSHRVVVPPERAPARLRSDSEATEFEEDDDSPTARDVKPSTLLGSGAATGTNGPNLRGGAVEIQNPERHRGVESAQPPPYSPPRDGKFQPYIAIQPPTHPAYRQPDSPGPQSPGMTQVLSSRGAIPMSDVPLAPAPASVRQPEAIATNQNDLYMRPRNVPITLAVLERPSDARLNAEARRQRLEKEDALGKKLGGLWRGRACFSSKGCFGRGGAEGWKKRRWIIGLTVGGLLMIVLIVVLAMTLHRKPPAHTTPTTGLQWLNLTGFPPIPTGVNTIIRPDAFSVVTACVFPSTMWSCSLPKELQQSISPNDSDQPNFKLQIFYRNDSISNSSGTNSHKRTRDVAGNAVSAGDIIRERILRARDAVPDAFWQPVPSPPSLEDQQFLGNTTDDVQSSNKEGEATPFYISFLPSTSPSRKLFKRQQQNSSDAFPDLTADIPPPDSAPDGTAAPANLLPSQLPAQQPVRLYDRGLPTEHYGFYNYFDRSIFLKSTAMLNQSDVPLGPIPDDENGGSTAAEARVRCTWAQTRFLVQIWTNMGNQQLITSKDGSSASGSSPGSFPYPVSVTVDRHGGDVDQKKVYCYGMDLRERIVASQKQIALENRGFGGTLVGGGQGPLGSTITVAQGGLGGIDGGTGGCRCEWRNFRAPE